MKKLFVILNLLFFVNISAQKKIKLLSTELSKYDEVNYPGAVILMGNVKFEHEGATLDCKRALFFRKNNLVKAVGEVVIEQGDSIIQYSDFASYDGNTRIAKSWGNVEANDKMMKLSTDTLYFDRNKQLAYYPTRGKIQDKQNTLVSDVGTYYFLEKKFVANSNVKITNPDSDIDSERLDYYTQTNNAHIMGSTTIFNKKDSTKVYTERGFYDSKSQVSYAVKNNKLFLKAGRTIVADSLYYNKIRGYASATNNIKVNDTVNKMFARGHYSEVFEKKDSIVLTKRAYSATLIDRDSMFIHGDKILVTGKKKDRVVRAFHNVKIFKSDLQGKCDSIYTSERTGLTKMYRKPVLWSGKNQVTGEKIYFLVDTNTKKMDSLFVYKKAFMVQKDSIHIGKFNQIRGKNLFGKFESNSLRDILIKGNAESIFHYVDEKTLALNTITKNIASNIRFLFTEKGLEQIEYMKQTEGKTYPPSMYPKDMEKLKGFIWREEEQPKSKEDIFIDSSSVKPTVKSNTRTFESEIRKTEEKYKELNDKQIKSE